MPEPADAFGPATVVLDTNAVLDWLVFADAGMQPMGSAIVQGRLRWLACPGMRAELQHMLEHASLSRWKADSACILTCFDRHVSLQPEPQLLPAPRWRCSDPDDQVFLDLALLHRVNWLVTHDRALLKLARRVRATGLHIIEPGQWSGLQGTRSAR